MNSWKKVAALRAKSPDVRTDFRLNPNAQDADEIPYHLEKTNRESLQ